MFRATKTGHFAHVVSLCIINKHTRRGCSSLVAIGKFTLSILQKLNSTRGKSCKAQGRPKKTYFTILKRYRHRVIDTDLNWASYDTIKTNTRSIFFSLFICIGKRDRSNSSWVRLRAFLERWAGVHPPCACLWRCGKNITFS